MEVEELHPIEQKREWLELAGETLCLLWCWSLWWLCMKVRPEIIHKGM